MKTLLSFILFPILMLSQPYDNPHNEYIEIDFSMESIINEGLASTELANGHIEVFVTVEVYVREMEIDHVLPEFAYDGAMAYSLPKYLNIFSLAGWSPFEKEDQRPEERLNGLLALNDPMFSKEDTLLNWLHPVRYQQNKLWGGAENMPEGFGPRIRL
ncbi:hypothetical protein [Allomuricauda sp. SCSIO 65647]|uniref:hypothetical protein n=1 Tax=Allomuricauda sp. SCSIO 65647 TaxID=2908843 RepID=UPI001F342601|nr:hypothetical protein [Muricauda sp. SCSIO 65647]UJH66407.1 hypothetical protein L0P89_10550 [Muricauda sp. SCSIO 65647]